MESLQHLVFGRIQSLGEFRVGGDLLEKGPQMLALARRSKVTHTSVAFCEPPPDLEFSVQATQSHFAMLHLVQGIGFRVCDPGTASRCLKTGVW